MAEQNKAEAGVVERGRRMTMAGQRPAPAPGHWIRPSLHPVIPLWESVALPSLLNYCRLAAAEISRHEAAALHQVTWDDRRFPPAEELSSMASAIMHCKA
jgi:hypothetical protein